MRIGLLAEGRHPRADGGAGCWCDRLVHGLDRREFDVHAFSRSEAQEAAGRFPLPPQVGRVRTAPLWTAPDDGAVYGRRARRRFREHYGEPAAGPTPPRDPSPHGRGALPCAPPRRHP